jgi:hypothetical protein
MDGAAARSLGALQEQLWRLITQPSGVEEAPAAGGGRESGKLAALVRGDRRLGPAGRVAVYANAYFARIHDCLREDFGALARSLGPAAFHDVVKTYLMIHPPARPSLQYVGARLAPHLSTEPFDAIFSRHCPHGADLARLEWAITEAFYAADSPVLGHEDLATVAAADWGGLRFQPVPSLRMLTCAWPVHSVRESFDRADDEAAWEEARRPEPRRTHLRVWRLDERVRYQAISELEVEALGAVRAGQRFGAICERLASTLGETEAASEAALLLATWVSGGLLARLL